MAGRAKPFDQLLLEHREAKEALALAKAAADGAKLPSGVSSKLANSSTTLSTKQLALSSVAESATKSATNTRAVSTTYPAGSFDIHSQKPR